jgi:hypothetical protein
MIKKGRVRFFVEVALASIWGFLVVLTLVWSDWIEALFGVDPDRHSGSFEWGVVFVLAALTGIFSLLAHAEWRRRRRAQRAALPSPSIR